MFKKVKVVVFITMLAVASYSQDKKEDAVTKSVVKLDELTTEKLKNFQLQRQNIQLQYTGLKAQVDAQFNGSDQVKQLMKQMEGLNQEQAEFNKKLLDQNKLDAAKFQVNADKGVIEEIPAPPVEKK